MEQSIAAERDERTQRPSGEAESAAYLTPGQLMVRRFFREKTAVAGLVFVILLILAAVAAPLFVNGKPLLIISASGALSSPALRDFFAPDAQEVFVEKMFNWLFLAIPAALILYGCFRKIRRIPWGALDMILILALLAVPFCTTRSQTPHTNWRRVAAVNKSPKMIHIFAAADKTPKMIYLFAVVPYGPFETSPDTHARPSREHPLGTDNMGRDVFARMIHGARMIPAVGFLATFAAPLFVNGKPLLIISVSKGLSLSSPALRDYFAPDAQNVFLEKIINWLFLAIPAVLLLYGFFRKKRRFWPALAVVLVMVLLAVPFCTLRSQMTQTDWRKVAAEDTASKYYFAVVPYGPFETSPDTYAMPSRKHPFGTDNVGRDVFARMMYGARVSLAVGFLATAIELVLGTMIGLFSGYRGGRIDLIVQRLVEIVICFPTFLLLLILMAIMLDYGTRQSILLVIFVLGMTGWPGLSRLVRGEVLKARQMAYIQSCESLGVPLRSILFRHLLPNVSGPIFVSFAFSIAGAILAENSLSFLGFGVQAPSASWGELLKQAFADPLSYWNLMLWPGLAIFLCVTAFNFIADGIRRSIDLKS